MSHMQVNCAKIQCENVWGFDKIPDDFEIEVSQKEGLSGQMDNNSTYSWTHSIANSLDCQPAS